LLHCPDNDIVHIGIWRSMAGLAMAVLAMAGLAMAGLAMAGLGRVLVPRLIRW